MVVRIQFSESNTLRFLGHRPPDPHYICSFYSLGLKASFIYVLFYQAKEFSIFCCGCLNLSASLFIGLWSMYEMFSSLW